jgi:hypothetical protein
MTNVIDWTADAHTDASLDGVNVLALTGYFLVYNAEDEAATGFESSLATELD